VLVELSVGWVIALNIIAWASIQMGLAWGFTQLAPGRFDPASGAARPRTWERRGRIYERLFFIKAWKDKLPDAAVWFRGGFAKASLRSRSPDDLARLARETWRGEIVHWLAILALPFFCIWNPWWAVLINAAYAAAANLPCILVQRYNRARLQRLLSGCD
jgi:glycosyl-4,4'-diaponeurosporenoate acyltransferase